jgi:spermidine synthase
LIKKRTLLTKLLSFFIPITIFKQNSSVSNSIEITWSNGQLVLDSKNTNYSYGSLQRILRKGLQSIGFENIKTLDSILVLGVAGGSVIKTLVNEVEFKGEIIGVEIDPDIISLANQYFKLDEIPNLTILIEDANKFVQKSNKTFDLIIIDIFQDNSMPVCLFETAFIENTISHLNPCGFLLFNTMINSKIDQERNKYYLSYFNSKEFTTYSLPKVEVYNELIVVKKTKS